MTDSEADVLMGDAGAASEPQSQPSTSQARQKKITNWAFKTTEQTREELDMKVARFFYACNISFMSSEHEAFQDLIKSLRPGYAPPSRKALAGRLLNKTYTDLKEDMKEAINGSKHVTLVQDGWSDIANSPVVAHTLHTPRKVFFLNSVWVEEMPKTAENCARLAEDAIKEAQNEYGVSITGLVTDNAATMNRMRELVSARHPEVSVWGCLSPP